jgi:hypothetical protein
MTLEIGMLFGRQVTLDEICEKPDEIVAATFLRHGQSFQLLGCRPSATARSAKAKAQFTLTQNREKLKLKPAYVGRARVLDPGPTD